MTRHLRLTCPNCAAQYEVDEGVIPEDGRDVQCSNCGTTWWQGRDDAAAIEPEAAAAAEPPPEAAPQPAPQPAPEPAPEAGIAGEAARDEAPAPEPLHEVQPAEQSEGGHDGQSAVRDEAGHGGADPAPADSVHAPLQAPPEANAEAGATLPADVSASHPSDDEDYEDEEDGASPALPFVAGAAGAELPRRSLDEAVLEVLREEAEREAAARRQEEVIETQPELGLDSTAPAPEPLPPAEPIAAPRGRVTKLPDIDEINSTLGSESGRQDEVIAAEPDPARRRTGFRMGFMLMVLLAAALAVGYVYEGRIATRFPAAASSLGQINDRLDDARVWLDGAALSASEKIRGLTR